MNNYIDFKNEKDYEKLKEVANVIKQGGIVIFPTETVYGIGTNGLDEVAIEKLYKIKERPLNKPISLLVSDFEMIKKVTKGISDIEYKIMKKFFPGPLTIILKKRDIVPDILTNGGDTVGIRMPDSEITRKLIEYVGLPIATTSANISGEKSGTNIEDIMKDFEGKVEYFINNGESKLGIGSTVVKVVENDTVILREGNIKKEEIGRTLICNKNEMKM